MEQNGAKYWFGIINQQKQINLNLKMGKYSHKNGGSGQEGGRERESLEKFPKPSL